MYLIVNINNNVIIITITDLLADRTLFLSDYMYVKQFLFIRQTFLVDYSCTLLKYPLPGSIEH